MNIGSKVSLAIKEAGGIAKAARKAYTVSSKYIDDILKGEKSLLAVRPALIAERESAELIAKRGAFENIPEIWLSQLFRVIIIYPVFNKMFSTFKALENPYIFINL